MLSFFHKQVIPNRYVIKIFLKYCLKFQYLAKHKYEIFGDFRPPKERFQTCNQLINENFVNELKKIALIEEYDFDKLHHLNKKHGRVFVNKLVFENASLDHQFYLAINDKKEPFEKLCNLLFRDNYPFNNWSDFLWFSKFVVDESNGLLFPKRREDLIIWKEKTEIFLNKKETYEEIISRHKKSWFPSKGQIFYWENKLHCHCEEIKKFINEVSAYYEEVRFDYFYIKEIQKEFLGLFNS